MNDRFNQMNVWERGGFKRRYMKRYQIQEALGMKVEYYKTGNISHAYIGENHISNCEARRILNSAVYYDVVNECWNFGYLEDYKNEILTYFA